MNKLLQSAVSAVKGQFTTVPLDDPDDTTEVATAAEAGSSVAAPPRRAAAPPPPPPPPPTSSSTAAASAAPTPLREVAPPTPGNAAAGAAAPAADAAAAQPSPVVNMMSRLSGIFGRGGESGNVKESAGLLTPDADLEAGSASAEGGGDASAAGAAAPAPAAGLLGSWFGSTAPAGGTAGEDAATASAPAGEAGGGGIGSWLNPMSILKTREKNMWDNICPEVSRANRLTGFFVLAGLSALFFLLAFFVGLPMVLLAPTKFALSFTVGSLCFMLAFAVLEGPASYFTNNCSRERLPFAAAYFLSLLATLYVSFFGKGYLLTVLTASVQVVALAWYGSTYFPGGQAAMKFVASMGWGAAKSVMALAMNCFNKE